MATYVTKYYDKRGRKHVVRKAVSIKTAFRMAFRESKGIPVIPQQVGQRG